MNNIKSLLQDKKIRSIAIIAVLVVVLVIFAISMGSGVNKDPSKLEKSDIPLIISEYSISGDDKDFIEFRNTSKEELTVKGMTLVVKGKDKTKIKKVKFSSEEYLFLNTKDYLAKVKFSDGDKLYIADNNGKLIDMVEVKLTSSTSSVSRKPKNDTIKEEVLPYRTPGFGNNASGLNKFNKQNNVKMSNKQVYISEICSKNTKYAPVNDKFYDWIELYNPTDNDISLKGYSIVNNKKTEEKASFSDVSIKAKSYLLVYSTDKKISGVLNTGFDLNGDKSVYLLNEKGNIIDIADYSDLLVNISLGRENGSAAFNYYSVPTPGAANANSSESILKSPKASQKSGQYNNIESLQVELKGSGDIYYTTDGSEPTKNSTLYKEPLTLNKTTVIRAVSSDGKNITSDIANYSYIINENHTMDVISVVGNPNGLFSQSEGIFEKGSHASSVFPYSGANFWQGWKRVVNMSLIPADGSKEKGFSQNGEISIFGGYTRAYSKKSFKIKFKDIYGNGKLNYKLYENRDFEEFDSLVIRAGGQDAFKTMMKDDVTTALGDAVLDVMASRPIVLYINGEYFGIFYIREKINEDFIASHYNVSPSSVDLIQGNNTTNAGSNEDWMALNEYIKTHDLSNDDNYNYVCSKLDVQNFADYIIAETYCGNSDQGNVRRFRTTDTDGKYRYILYDTDMGFQSGLDNSFADLTNTEGTGAGNAFSTAIINGLLKNSKFRALFIERLEYNMKNVWNTERVIKEIERVESIISGEVARNNKRWDCSFNWQEGVEYLKTFARGRQAVLKNEFATSSTVRNKIALTDEELNRCFGY